MLVCSRKKGERMVTGDDIVTTVVASKRGRFELGCSGTRSRRGQSRCNHGVDLAYLASQGGT